MYAGQTVFLGNLPDYSTQDTMILRVYCVSVHCVLPYVLIIALKILSIHCMLPYRCISLISTHSLNVTYTVPASGKGCLC